MKRYCPKNCKHAETNQPSIRRIGEYFRKSDSKWIKRWQCRICGKTFSAATDNPFHNLNKRRINKTVFNMLNSNMSERRISLILGIHRRTVAKRREIYNELSMKSEKSRKAKQKPVSLIQFDDLETFEHTKCKPISVALAINKVTRRIEGFTVSQMPAKGPLAELARKKYGPRDDERAKGWEELFKSLQDVVSPDAIFTSDKHHSYPKYVKKYFPKAKHIRVKGRRGCITGQGELKKIGYDPLFSLNHTCAMLRANINRLIRRTWCTTKKIENLREHISCYVKFHNEILIT